VVTQPVISTIVGLLLRIPGDADFFSGDLGVTMIIAPPLGSSPHSVDAARGQPGWLRVFPFPNDVHLVLVVAGDADINTAAELTEQIAAAIALGHSPLIVDVSDLDFCDLSGLDVLNAAVEEAEKRGIVMTIRGMSPQLAWLHRTFPVQARAVGMT
jgi:anti-anti-sigma factor